MMKRIGIYMIAFLLGMSAFAQNTKKLAERGDVQACVTLAKEAVADYRFDEAQEWLDKAEVTLKKKKQQNEQVEQLREEAARGERFLRGTDQVLIIDSMVVDKAEFLQAYRISEETGSLDSYAHFFTSVEDGTLYKTELGNRIYFGKRVEDGSKRICSSDQLAGGTWGEPHELAGLSAEGTNEDYPFMTSDGLTLYFASENREDGLGGYDIYVTREGDNNRYLKPENMGMPYNSPANDYMMVIDELNELGWFASDRYQPEGMVCIYVFVPNESRHPFDYDSDDMDDIRATAMLRSISETQNDEELLNKGRLHLKEALLYRPEAKVVKEFEIVIDDTRIYTSYIHFKNNQAAMLCKEWVGKKKELANLEEQLENNRKSYSAGTYKLADTIRKQEAQLESMLAEVKNMEKQVRKLELQ